MDQQRLYQVALSLIPGIGGVLGKQLLNYCGSAEAIFHTSKSKLNKIPGIGIKAIEDIHKKDLLLDAENELTKIDKSGSKLLFYTDPEFPRRLSHIYNAPVILYYRGSANLNQEKVIGIVGTRKATHYGKQVVEEIVKGLKKHHPLIVSGLAYGIDIHAHKCALKEGLETIGVMASGLNIIYPKIHTSKAQNMTAQGGLLTELRFDTKPEPGQFPARNRIIAGLCDVIMVVEAARRGGALITAEFANSYNREVFAVPGNVKRPFSEGCNRLIQRHKANIYTNISDIEYLMNWDIDAHQASTNNELNFDLSEFGGEEWSIIQLLNEHKKEMLIDELSWKSEISPNQIACLLLNLEFKGIVKSLPGKKYVLNK